MPSKKLLIVEDDPMSLYALKTVLQDRGFQVVACVSAEDALAHDHQHFDAAILDVRLPGMSGPEFAVKLRQNHMPSKIIFVTAYNGVNELRESFPGSIALVKPLNIDALIRLL